MSKPYRHSKNGVVHQMCLTEMGGYGRHAFNPVTKKLEYLGDVPISKAYTSKCLWGIKLDEDYKFDESLEVTCKNCLKRMGARELPKKRYVLKHRKTGYYYKKGRDYIVSTIDNAEIFRCKPKENSTWKRVRVRIVEDKGDDI